jgi:hypothetical protein
VAEVERIEVNIVAIDEATPALLRAREVMQAFSAGNAAAATSQARLATTPTVQPLDAVVERHIATLSNAYGVLGHSQEEAIALAGRHRERLEEIARSEAHTTIEKMTTAAGEAEGRFAHLHETMREVGRIALGFAIGDLIGAVTGGVARQFEEVLTGTVELGRETRLTQLQIGGSAEQVSGLLAVFHRFGIEQELAGRSLVFFGRGIQGSVDATEAQLVSGRSFASTLAQLGVSATDATGHFRPMRDVLLDVAEGFRRTGATGVEVQALFGRSGRNLVSFLSQGREGVEKLEESMREMGLTLTGEDLGAITRYRMAQKDLTEAMEGLRIQMGVALMPLFTELATSAAHAAEALNKDAGTSIRGIAGDVMSAADGIRELIRLLGDLEPHRTASAGAAGGRPVEGGVFNALPGGEKGPARGDLVVGTPELANRLGFGAQIDLSQGLPKALAEAQMFLTAHQGDIVRAMAGGELSAELVQELNAAGQAEVDRQRQRVAVMAAAPARPAPRAARGRSSTGRWSNSGISRSAVRWTWTTSRHNSRRRSWTGSTGRSGRRPTPPARASPAVAPRSVRPWRPATVAEVAGGGRR